MINDGIKARVGHNVGQILSGICLGKMIEKYQKIFFVEVRKITNPITYPNDLFSHFLFKICEIGPWVFTKTNFLFLATYSQNKAKVK